MSKNYRELDENSDEQQLDVDFNPFDEAVNEKPYTKPNVVFKQEDLMTDIPEPSIIPQMMDADELKDAGNSPTSHSSSTLGNKQYSKQPKKESEPPVNPKYDEMSKKEQKASSLHLAKTMVGGYEFLCNAANKKLLFSEKKMMKLAQEGEVDFSLQIPYDLNGNTMSLGDFVGEYNEQQKDSLAVTEEFKEEAIPLLAKILDKRGMGLTDEQRFYMLVGGDAAQKVVVAITAMSTMKQMVETFKEITVSTKGSQEIPQYRPEKTENNYAQERKNQSAYQDIIVQENNNDNESSNSYYEEPDEINTTEEENDIIYDLQDEVESQITGESDKQKKTESSIKIIKKPTQKKGLGKRGAPPKK